MAKFDTLYTPYAEKMDKSAPHDYYPRPSLKRDSFFSLNGEWDFSVTDATGNRSDAKILVPFPPESKLSGYEREIPRGALMEYRRVFTLPEGFLRDRLVIHFGAVDCISELFINGISVHRNEGGYLPFSADITENIKEGENEILLTVRDDLSPLYPYGKQRRDRGGMWYTPVSGIWQTVWLESLPERYIEKLKVTPTLSSVTVKVFGGEEEKLFTFGEKEYRFSGDTLTVEIENPILWSPENPHIYGFSLKSGEDEVESYFALREIGTKAVGGVTRLTLNGEPYLFNGLLDQGYYPDGIFLPATLDGYRDDILTAKSLGFNMLRKHIKVEPEIFYYLCDTLGMVVFQDMVNNSGYSFLLDTVLPTVGLKRLPDRFKHRNKTSRKIFTEHMLATIEHLYNFPSILYYTVFNEGWGQFSADEMYSVAKSADSTRIIDATSGWFTRKKSDVDSRHVYFKAVKVGKISNRPTVISEFGGYSHRVDGHLFGSKNYGYRLFDSVEDFESAFLSLYENEILPGVRESFSALVYTQLSDVEDETNGLITYDRRVVKLNREKSCAMMARLYDAIK